MDNSNKYEQDNLQQPEDFKQYEHEYDGIKELDNPPPRWIMWLFYLTIGISILYGAYYYWLGIGPDQDEEYLRRVARHEAKFGSSENAQVAMILLTDAPSLEKGHAVFTEMNCAACHGQAGEGNAIGPNLTDNFWIHGCTVENVANVVRNGVPAKGMTAYKSMLSDEKIQQVSSYILQTLVGSNPAAGREPQGDECAKPATP